ncbi:sigma-54 dependent transcriptional regulator [Thiohalophilus sp.]|uniref:sigma-54-dependent transcriptional regulator n=1 Tax=Thiohalophilus sp. TaxID=3028392 RepID=UPI002ACE4A9C|nr:sigma-54 dependent transcriptional regulator [Thiohalophilus sp.]MDZ7802633.1 sigma-54 dependent transcriptional regulator [Thiohalophilus sp.]
MTASSILVVEDDDALAEALQDTLKLAGYESVLAANGIEALRAMEQQHFDIVVSDINMPKMDGETLLKRLRSQYPDTPVMLMTAYGTIQQAVDAMREGAADYLVKPFEAEVLVNMVGQYIGQPEAETDMVAVAPASRELAAMARKVADSDATVMITGESGVGKEVLARFVHQHSSRAEQPFVAINCAAIPENMLEATLFGYEKGAYTGAYKASPGKFEQAQGGTLLLDEISEMDIGLQAKLLRVLQEREVERLGGNNVIQLDVRVLATSNRDMRQVVAEGRFREDLFYRLNVFPLHLQPLRERLEDIGPIAERLLEKQARNEGRMIPRLDEAALQRLQSHTWPGNIRELDNVMQRAMILQSGEVIETGDIHFETATVPVQETPAVTPVSAPAVTSQPAPAAQSEVEDEADVDSLNQDLRHREWDLILNAIKKYGSRKATAEQLGISQRTLRYKLARMREAGIRVPEASGFETA